MSRPRIAPAVVAALSAQVPARLVKKLDAAPRAAEAWRWAADADGAWTVVSDTGETVTLAGSALTEPAALRCTCLLAPRCFHLLAVAAVLELTEHAPPVDSAPASDVAPAPAATVALDPEQGRAADETWRAAAELLDAGAAGAGQTLQAELLRSVHSCRATGLVRLAAAGVRVVRSVRDLRADSPDFSLRALARDLTELLETAWALRAGGAADVARVGVARRAYARVGSLRVHGLFTEPVIAASGYAGVVTHLVDGTGRLWTLSAVAPGDAGQVAAAYASAAAVGDATLPHRLLGREGLFVQDATGSGDGRLGSGKDVRAVRAGGTPWTEEPLAALWRTPLADQLARAAAAQAVAVSERPVGADLVFFQGRVLARAGAALVVAARDGGGERPLRCVASSGHEGLGADDDLAVLACAPGLELRCVARAREDRAPTVALLAVGAVDERLRLPAEWAGRANLGLDRLGRAFVAGAADAPVELPSPPEPPDPLDALRRRLERHALGGRSAASSAGLAQVDVEARALERRLMPTAALLHRALAAAAVETGRSFAGARTRADAGRLASAWLACAVYERSAAHAE